jgi:hypothetical protein
MPKQVYNPYWLLVLAASAFATIGVFPWILFGFMPLNTYPGDFHKESMVFGFAAALVLAIWFREVRLTTTSVVVLSSIFILEFTSLIFGTRASSISIVAFLMVVAFIIRLRTGPKLEAPSLAVYILTLVIILTCCLFQHLGSNLSYEWQVASRHLTFKGILIGGLFCSANMIKACLYPERPVRDSWWLPIGLGFIFLGFLAEGIGSHPLLSIGRAAGVLALGVILPPKERKGLSLWAWMACVSLYSGFILAAFFPNYEVHLMHLVYVSGIGLMAFVISGHPLLLQLKSKALTSIGWMLVIAGLTRSTAIFLAGSYERHLAYAAMLWIISIGVWLRWIFPLLRSGGDKSRVF